MGFTMKSNIAISKKLGYLEYDPKIIIETKDIAKYRPEEITILCTGAQGEDNAALMRIINREDKFVRIQKNDTVVFSSSIVPGNEVAVQGLKDNLSKQGAKLYHYKMLDIHASGHAHKEDIKLMLNLIKPKYVMPVHGYYYMQKLMADLAQETLGIDSAHTILAACGQVIDLTNQKTSLTNKFVPANYVMVDGLGVGDVGEVVLRDRETLAKDGMFIITTIMDAKTKEIKTIEIVSRGFVFMKDAGELIRDTREKVESLIKKSTANIMSGTINESYLRNALRDEIGLFLFQRTERRPMIVPIIIES
jgi:ribonuclease J